MSVRELSMKLKDHLAKYEKEKAIMEKKVLDGKMSKKEYKTWLEIQAMQGRHYRNMAEVLTQDAVNANKIAVAMTNDTMADVFALNANYTTYYIESDIRLDTNFSLYNRDTVKVLAKDDPTLLKTLNQDKAKDYSWNRKRFNNAITQGILQGESIPKIATRVLFVTNGNYKAAVRNARTATTCAEAMGRMNSFNRAESLGIKMTKIWMATLDNRTRHSHRILDGQEVALNEPFQGDYSEIMFPGDPDGDPADVYNCRCTIIGGTPNIDYDATDMDSRFSDLPAGLSYEEWEEMHEVM